jgi:hypothetical protein
MRWKISRHGHDVRQIDLLAVLALLIVIIGAWRYFDGSHEPESTAAFIEPSQSVRW